MIVTEYKRQYYSDIVQSGYPFTTYLKPDLSGWVKNLFNRKEIEKFILKTFFLNQEEIVLAACSTEEKKVAGVVTLRQITDNLWGIWDIFVSPPYRGKRIASLLYEESFNLLKIKNAKKATGAVDLSNVSSIKSIQRNWQGFLPKRVFKCMVGGQISKCNSDKVTIRKPYRGERRYLFEIFKSCVGEQWCSFLEIDQNNYLDRIFGFSYFEPASKSLLARLTMKKDISVAEYKGELHGYAILRMIRFFQAYHAIHMFVPITENFDDVSGALLLRAFNLSMHKRRKLNFVYVGNTGIQDRLRNLGFEVVERLVCYKYL